MLAFEHHPVQILQDGTLAVLDGNVVELDNFLWHWGNYLRLFQENGVRTVLDGEAGLYLDVLHKAQINHFNYTGYKLGYLVHLREH